MGDNLPRSSSIEGKTSISSPLPGLFSSTVTEDLSPRENGGIETCNKKTELKIYKNTCMKTMNISFFLNYKNMHRKIYKFKA